VAPFRTPPRPNITRRSDQQPSRAGGPRRDPRFRAAARPAYSRSGSLQSSAGQVNDTKVVPRRLTLPGACPNLCRRWDFAGSWCWRHSAGPGRAGCGAAHSVGSGYGDYSADGTITAATTPPLTCRTRSDRFPPTSPNTTRASKNALTTPWPNVREDAVRAVPPPPPFRKKKAACGWGRLAEATKQPKLPSNSAPHEPWVPPGVSLGARGPRPRCRNDHRRDPRSSPTTRAASRLRRSPRQSSPSLRILLGHRDTIGPLVGAR